MVREELIKKSPLRILEKSTHGGVGKGNIGIISSRKGVGKTACLVHIATDQLFQDKHVIHVSFSSNTQHIVDWYEEIFTEIAKRRSLDDIMSVHDNIIKNRVILNFNQDGIKMSQVVNTITSLIENGDFHADVIIFDGYDFAKGSVDDLKELREAAKKLKLEYWFSASIKEDTVDAMGIPAVLTSYMEEVAILIALKNEEGMIHLHLKKDHDGLTTGDLHLKLDPKVLLITQE